MARNGARLSRPQSPRYRPQVVGSRRNPNHQNCKLGLRPPELTSGVGRLPKRDRRDQLQVRISSGKPTLSDQGLALRPFAAAASSIAMLSPKCPAMTVSERASCATAGKLRSADCWPPECRILRQLRLGRPALRKSQAPTPREGLGILGICSLLTSISSHRNRECSPFGLRQFGNGATSPNLQRSKQGVRPGQPFRPPSPPISGH